MVELQKLCSFLIAALKDEDENVIELVDEQGEIMDEAENAMWSAFATTKGINSARQ